MEREPTQEQIKEFWEWCGLAQNPWTKEWFTGRSIPGYIGTRLSPQPILDLNSLFKYAVPKLKVVTLTNGYKGWTATVNQGEMIKGKVKATGESNSPNLALFWAIWEVIQEVSRGTE